MLSHSMQPPNDIILTHKEHWEYPTKTGGRAVSNRTTTMSYHISKLCLLSRFPFLEHDISSVSIPVHIDRLLEGRHHQLLEEVLSMRKIVSEPMDTVDVCSDDRYFDHVWDHKDFVI